MMLAKSLFRHPRTKSLAAKVLHRWLSTDKPNPTAWLPPQRPLIGDQLSYAAPVVDDDDEEELRLLQQEIDRLEQEENDQIQSSASTALDQEVRVLPSTQESTTSSTGGFGETKGNDPVASLIDEDSSIDWLRTRRRLRGGEDDEPVLEGRIVGSARHDALFEIEVKHHTLMSRDEIATIVESTGGQDMVIIYDDPHERRFGGATARVLVTASRPSQMKIIADTLVRHMRRRKLQECDVFAAQQGPEGDEASNWMVVDCRNFVVHIMEEQMRKDLNLEDLWSGKDPVYNVNFYDEEEIDDYVAANPVPETYGTPAFDWDERFRELQKNRWTAPHKPVVKRPRMKRKKR